MVIGKYRVINVIRQMYVETVSYCIQENLGVDWLDSVPEVGRRGNGNYRVRIRYDGSISPSHINNSPQVRVLPYGVLHGIGWWWVLR